MDLTTIDQLNDMLNSVLDGEQTADGMPDEVQHWLMMSVANFACHVAKGKTKEERAERLALVPDVFKVDVEPLAKQMFIHYSNTI
jgi:hypothetical protein